MTWEGARYGDRVPVGCYGRGKLQGGAIGLGIGQCRGEAWRRKGPSSVGPSSGAFVIVRRSLAAIGGASFFITLHTLLRTVACGLALLQGVTCCTIKRRMRCSRPACHEASILCTVLERIDSWGNYCIAVACPVGSCMAYGTSHIHGGYTLCLWVTTATPYRYVIRTWDTRDAHRWAVRKQQARKVDLLIYACLHPAAHVPTQRFFAWLLLQSGSLRTVAPCNASSCTHG